MSDLTFEQAVSRLEEVIQKLDDGNLSLDESLGLFEEGIKLSRQCSKQLTAAQGRLETVIKKSDGSIETKMVDG